MDEIEPSVRLYNEEDAEFMTVTALSELDSEEPAKTPITFVLKGGSLVTVRYSQPMPFTFFAQRIQKPGGSVCTSGEMAMLGIIEAMINRMADILERVGEAVDRFSHKVFRSKVRNVTQKTLNLNAVIEQIGRKGDMLSMVRESLVSFTRLLSYHQAIAKGTTKAGKDVRQKMKILHRDVGSLTDHAAFLTNKINFLLDATLGLINLEQNQIIKIFSVAAVVFLPPTLVALWHEFRLYARIEMGGRLSLGIFPDDPVRGFALSLFQAARLALRRVPFRLRHRRVAVGNACRKLGGCSRRFGRLGRFSFGRSDHRLADHDRHLRHRLAVGPCRHHTRPRWRRAGTCR
jgi:Mg2+ and Co2+ transporter CorA